MSAKKRNSSSQVDGKGKGKSKGKGKGEKKQKVHKDGEGKEGKEGKEGEEYSYGSLININLSDLVSDSQISAGKLRNKAKTEREESQLKERAEGFNERRGKVFYSLEDLNFFARTLACSFTKKDLQEEGKRLGEEVKGNKKDVILKLLTLPIELKLAGDKFCLSTNEELYSDPLGLKDLENREMDALDGSEAADLEKALRLSVAKSKGKRGDAHADEKERECKEKEQEENLRLINFSPEERREIIGIFRRGQGQEKKQKTVSFVLPDEDAATGKCDPLQNHTYASIQDKEYEELEKQVLEYKKRTEESLKSLENLLTIRKRGMEKEEKKTQSEGAGSPTVPHNQKPGESRGWGPRVLHQTSVTLESVQSQVTESQEKRDKKRAEVIIDSGVMDGFPEFRYMSFEIKILILNLRFFDLRLLVQDFENKPELLLGTGVSRKPVLPQTLGLTWEGFSHALTTLQVWAKVFAPEQVGMMLVHQVKLEQYHHQNYQLHQLIKYSNYMRMNSTGVPGANWGEPNIEMEAFRLHMNLERVPRAFLIEVPSKERYSPGKAYNFGGPSNFGAMRSTRGKGFASRGGGKVDRPCRYLENGVVCPFLQKGFCRYSHESLEKGRGRGMEATFRDLDTGGVRGRGRGRGY
jgi:hypothetical protein